MIPIAKRQFGFLTVLFFAMTGCTTDNSDPISSKPILIHAASSTQDALKEVAATFQKQIRLENPNRKRTDTLVRINSAGSNTLATQIMAGSPGDLFLCANARWANEVRTNSKVSRSTILLKGSLVLIAPKSFPMSAGDPTNKSFWKEKSIAIAGKDVPAGQYTRQVLGKFDLLNSLIQNRQLIQGQNVRHVLSYTESAEVDFGIVYHTDAMISDRVKIIHRFDSANYDPILYELLLLKSQKENKTAAQFYRFLTSDAAARIFKRHGFHAVTTQERSTLVPGSIKGKN